MRIVLAIAMSLGTASAAAQQPLVDPPAPAPGASIGLRSLSVAELTACAQRSLDAQRGDAEIAAMQTRLNVAGQRLMREAKGIDAARAKVDVSKRAQIDAFNARGVRFRAETAAYNAEGAKFSARVKSLNRAADIYNIDCAQRPFDLADLARLPPELRAAQEKRSQRILTPLLVDAPAPAPAPAPAVVTAAPPPTIAPAPETAPPR